MELEQIRMQINEVDDRIAQLFCRRMQLCSDVAAYKHANDLRIRDCARDEVIYARVCDAVPPHLRQYVRQLYQTMLEISREYQREVMIQTDETEALHGVREQDAQTATL